MSDPVICQCNDITKSVIVKAIIEKKLKTADEVGQETTAGTVCGACIEDIENILKELNG